MGIRKLFRVELDGQFFADDIDDAIIRLVEHLSCIANGEDSSLFEPPSSLQIHEVKEGAYNALP